MTLLQIVATYSTCNVAQCHVANMTLYLKKSAIINVAIKILNYRQFIQKTS